MQNHFANTSTQQLGAYNLSSSSEVFDKIQTDNLYSEKLKNSKHHVASEKSQERRARATNDTVGPCLTHLTKPKTTRQIAKRAPKPLSESLSCKAQHTAVHR